MTFFSHLGCTWLFWWAIARKIIFIKTSRIKIIVEITCSIIFPMASFTRLFFSTVFALLEFLFSGICSGLLTHCDTVMYSYPGDNSRLSALPILMLPLGFLLCLRLFPSVSVLSPLSLCVRLFSVGLVPQKYRSLSFVPAKVKPLPQKIIYVKK